MPTLEELSAAGGPWHDALAAGIADISQATTVCFTIYQKIVLPLDGYVFWIRTGGFEQPGSIHYAATRVQEESETRARNTVIFTTQEQVQDLNAQDSQTLVIGEIGDQRYAFGRYGWFYPQAGVWHYQGDGINPSMATQLVDDSSQLDPSKVIVSGSLPAWLKLVSYLPVWVTWPKNRNPQITLYPSYLVPDNQEPPYGAVHIEPAEALQDIPWLSQKYSHYQLTREHVRITLYGCNNEIAADLLDLILQYSDDYNAFGLMSMPTIRDEKMPWSEGMVIAQRKTIELDVSYVQTRINDIARQLILEATVQIMPEGSMRTAGRFAAVAGFSAAIS